MSLQGEKNFRTLNQQGYDKVAQEYLELTLSRASPREQYTEKLLSRLSSPSTSRVLELGCGAGLPITKLLAERVSKVVANDLSNAQLELAKQNVPTATLMPGSIMDLNFDSESFHGIVSFFTLFHVPLDDQRIMLRRIFDWLKPGACFVGNLGAKADSGSQGNLLGVDMFFANFGAEGCLLELRQAGFDIDESEVRGAAEGLDVDDLDYGIEFVWILARKPPKG